MPESKSVSKSVQAEGSRQCQVHGVYGAVVIASTGTLKHYMRCPKCVAEQAHEAQVDADRRAHVHLQELLAGLAPRQRDATFGNFELLTPKHRAAISLAKSFAEQVSRTKYEVLGLIGPTGTGKTHLLAALARRMAERHIAVSRDTLREPSVLRFVSESHYLHAIKATWRRESTTDAMTVLMSYATPDLLCFDDLGAAVESAKDISEVNALIDARYARCLPTAFTSNLTVPEIATTFGARTADRLAEKCVYAVCDWPSYRRRT